MNVFDNYSEKRGYGDAATWDFGLEVSDCALRISKSQIQNSVLCSLRLRNHSVFGSLRGDYPKAKHGDDFQTNKLI